jgi:molecular chaperone DnaJ
MDKPDYYKILGISRQAPPQEIDRAYRKLARRYHPELNPGDEQAEQMYHQIVEAYEVLSDPRKRQIYDRYGEYREELDSEARASADLLFEGFDFGMGEKSFGDIFEELFGLESAARKKEPRRGEDVEIPLALTFEQALTGTTATLTVRRSETCSGCQGRGETSDSPTTCVRCGGSGRKQISRGRLRLSARCDHCQGTGRSHPLCPLCRGETRTPVEETITVQIPPGVDTGSRIRVPEKGEAGRYGGPPGDLYIVTNVGTHPFFLRKGDNIHCTVPITVAEAILGAKIEVPTIRGRAWLRIPPGTHSGQVFRLREQGVPSLRGDVCGDQYVEVTIVIPRLVDQRSRELIREFEQRNPENPRAPLAAIDPIIRQREGQE